MKPTLKSLLDRVQRHFGSRVAIVDGDTSLSYADVVARARSVAASLSSPGFASPTKVERVAILDLNSQRYLETYYACGLAGLTIVPLNFRLAASELEAILRHVDAQVLIVGEAFAQMAATLQVDVRQVLPDEFEALASAGLSEPEERQDPARVAAIYYTSGTTGEPKGVCLSEEGVLAAVGDAFYAMAFQPTDVWLHAAPMFHLADASLLWGLTAAGACHTLMRFEPALFLSAVERYRVTSTSLPPTLINMIVSLPQAASTDLSSLRRISFGGSPMPPDVFRRAREVLGCEMLQAYGTTEASGFVCCGMPGDEVEANLTIGRPVPSIQARVVLDDGSEAAVGEIGEIAIRGPKVMVGYWKNPEASSAAIRNGWYLSGDLGSQDQWGLISIKGRKKDMIITGGENVYAVEVENTLAAHPAIFEAAVFGINDAQWGEAVQAVVSLRAGSTLEADELRAWCKERIAGYKVPKSITISVDPLPKSGAGKIAKHLLRGNFK